MIARLTALNIVRTLIVQAAQVGDIDPLRISFVDTLRTILSFSAVLASAPVLALPELHHAMLAEITGHVIAERPGRLEPHYLTRERKHYPALRRQTGSVKIVSHFRLSWSLVWSWFVLVAPPWGCGVIG
ncbi:MAG: hypothetical protein JSW27_18745, partial [Phycisphaerales bacterium]